VIHYVLVSDDSVCLVPCRFRDCHNYLCQIFFVWNKTVFNRFSAGHCSRSWAHSAVDGFG